MIVECIAAATAVNMDKYYDVQTNDDDLRKWIVDTYFGRVETVISALTGDTSTYYIPKELVFAIMYQESRGNPYAYRYEPGFFSWLSRRISGDDAVRGLKQYVSKKTEMVGRSTSYGPMQILGQTAREMGFKGPYLTELCDPDQGIYYSTKYLLSRIKRHPSLEEHIAAFNSGTPKYHSKTNTLINAPYVESVKQQMNKFKEILQDV